MRNVDSISVRTAILFAGILLSLCGRAQSVPNPKMETPNVATLDKFGDIPVDLATGTPNISIPIHTLHYGSISVPIGLRYHPGAVQVKQHPGWVGLGWDLESGGAITRVVRGVPDEFYGTQVNEGAQSDYYPVPGFTASPGAQQINTNEYWYEPVNLTTYFTAQSGGGFNTDVSADEFSFNVMGHTGKFYYEGTTSGWQVASDEAIQVQLNPTPFISGTNVVATVTDEYTTATGNGHLWPNVTNTPTEVATQVFSGFILTVPDGTKYYFGGVNANGAGVGIEFYTVYGPNAVQFNANTWLLTKIVDVDGNEVDYNYSASYPVADMGIGFSANEYNCQEVTGGNLGGSSATGWQFVNAGSIVTTTYQGLLYLPLYLDNITCPNETVSFSRQTTNNCLRFPDAVYRFNPSNSSTVYGVMALLGDGKPDPNNPGGFIVGQNNLQWMQLNKIVITNGNGPPGSIGPNGIGQVYRQYSFNYSSNSSQRLTLMSFQESDNANNPVQLYSFGYNTAAGLLQTLYSGDQADHWGFYNGLTVAPVNPGDADNVSGSIFSAKVTMPLAVVTGLLTQITYPTGGHVNLTWKPHDYSQVVPNSRQSPLTSQTGYAGGSRIAEIQSYLPDNTLAHDKKYFYVRGYSNANPAGTGSSGILNGTPTYFMNLQNRLGIGGTIAESIEAISFNSMAVYSYNSEGSYIGYDQVVEQNEDNSYTINYFTSYGPDLNGISHFDTPPLGTIGWASTDNYYPVSELDMERGKPIGIFKYNAGGVLVQETINTYRNDATRFNNYAPLVNFNNSYSGCSLTDALVLATGYVRYLYAYYVTSQTVTTYDQNGMNPISTTTTYQYNPNNLVEAKTETDSKGDNIVTTYSYPPDMTDATSQAMTAAHILSPVELMTINNYGEYTGGLVNSTQTNYYSPYSGMYKPQSVQVQIGSNPVETRQSFYNYDNKGNVNEVSKTNDIHTVYLWSYFRQYPVAKIEGSTWNAVNAVAGGNLQGQIDALTTTATATSDAAVRNLLQSLRTGLPGALVTTYTYSPLTGITSETDPKGQITYYQYDAFQRLQVILDNDGNVLKTYNYQYQNP